MSEEQDVAPKRNKVVNINSTMQLQVVLVKPERFDDASAIADHLNAKRTVVLNLESTNKEVSRRLVDFLSGVAYTNNGQIKRVANSTFIITPYNVDIRGDLRDVINKNVTEEEIERTCNLAFSAGYTSVKLYFMLGLPTETMEDLSLIHI